MAIRSMKARELLRILARIGYSIDRREGSHRFMSHASRPRIVVAVHESREVPKATVRKILQKDVGLTDDEVDQFT